MFSPERLLVPGRPGGSRAGLEGAGQAWREPGRPGGESGGRRGMLADCGGSEDGHAIGRPGPVNCQPDSPSTAQNPGGGREEGTGGPYTIAGVLSPHQQPGVCPPYPPWVHRCCRPGYRTPPYRMPHTRLPR